MAPIFLAAPLMRQLASHATPREVRTGNSRAWASGTLLAMLMTATVIFARAHPFALSPEMTPAAAVQKLKEIDRPVLNDYDFGGYLIFAGVAPFIDGRTELYGEKFFVRYIRAVTLNDLGEFLNLLDEYKIGATLLRPGSPALPVMCGSRSTPGDQLNSRP